MGETHSKIYWHEAFYEAIQLELVEYKHILNFNNEHQLNKEALKIDVLIIKKEKDAIIKKNIGRIFREHNICEYKSETDSLSVYDYNKVNGYALLYSAFEKINLKEITLSFVVTKHPYQLFKYLKDERQLKIIEESSGIYYVLGDLMPVQILENKELSADDNLFLKGLRSNLSTLDMIKLLEVYQKQEEYDKKSVYIDRIMNANVKALKEVLHMSMSELEVFFREVAKERGWFDEIEQKGVELGIDKGILQGEKNKAIEFALELLSDGVAVEKISKWTKLPIMMINELKQEISV